MHGEEIMKHGRRILLVDDDHDILKGTRLRLRAAGYETIEAHSGADGVSSAIEHQPDAIIMDVRMKNMDGLTALSKLRVHTTTKHIPVVMLSASLTEQQAALDAGARYYLLKPYVGKNLVAAVDSVISETMSE